VVVGDDAEGLLLELWLRIALIEQSRSLRNSSVEDEEDEDEEDTSFDITLRNHNSKILQKFLSLLLF